MSHNPNRNLLNVIQDLMLSVANQEPSISKEEGVELANKVDWSHHQIMLMIKAILSVISPMKLSPVVNSFLLSTTNSIMTGSKQIIGSTLFRLGHYVPNVDQLIEAVLEVSPNEIKSHVVTILGDSTEVVTMTTPEISLKVTEYISNSDDAIDLLKQWDEWSNHPVTIITIANMIITPPVVCDWLLEESDERS